MSVEPQHIKAGAPGAPEPRAHCCLCQRMFTRGESRAASAADLTQLATEHTCEPAVEPMWVET